MPLLLIQNGPAAQASARSAAHASAPLTRVVRVHVTGLRHPSERTGGTGPPVLRAGDHHDECTTTGPGGAPTESGHRS